MKKKEKNDIEIKGISQEIKGVSKIKSGTNFLVSPFQGSRNILGI